MSHIVLNDRGNVQCTLTGTPPSALAYAPRCKIYLYYYKVGLITRTLPLMSFFLTSFWKLFFLYLMRGQIPPFILLRSLGMFIQSNKMHSFYQRKWGKGIKENHKEERKKENENTEKVIKRDKIDKWNIKKERKGMTAKGKHFSKTLC